MTKNIETDDIMINYITRIFEDLKGIRSVFNINDFFDIFFVTILIYFAIRVLRETKAQQFIKVIVIFLIAFGAAQIFHLNTVLAIMQLIAPVSVTILVVLFQPELRRVVEQASRTKFRNLIPFSQANNEEVETIVKKNIKDVCDSIVILQRQRMGALIVFERDSDLTNVLNTGTIVNAESSPELICNIFFNKAPLHDGALLIKDGRLHAAACILPLTSNSNISSELGTRHRAALGMSENSDAVIVVVSEETSAVSVALSGSLKRNLTTAEVENILTKMILPDNGTATQNKSSFWRKSK